MRQYNVRLPVLALLSATRGMIGLGIGLLIAHRITPERRRVVGSALLGVGALSTIPIAIWLYRHRIPARSVSEQRSVKAAV